MGCSLPVGVLVSPGVEFSVAKDLVGGIVLQKTLLQNFLPSLSIFKGGKLFYLGIFLSGFVSLVYQVAWQAYLTILLGSEAKSTCLVISVFLTSLALGYLAFGWWGSRWGSWGSRQLQMKIYGYIELAIAVYAMGFPLFFSWIKSLHFAGPHLLAFDILTALVAIFLPTFLMGASIPLLTRILPESPGEIHSTHSRVYAWNTLGAGLGVLVGGLLWIPLFGLPFTMLVAGGVNLFLSFIFLLNQLRGQPCHSRQPLETRSPETQVLEHPAPETRQEGPPSGGSSSGQIWIYLVVLVVGAVSISFENLLFRLVGLSIGSSPSVFPMVLAIFVFGLGYGSLRLSRIQGRGSRALGGRDLQGQKASEWKALLYWRLLWAGGLWTLTFASVPYWGFWASHLRISLTNIAPNYYLFQVLNFGFFFALLILPIFFMGQILPLAYSLLQKSPEDSGKKCGLLYFYNTLGTVLGGLVLGYWLLHYRDLDEIFQINIVLLLLTCGLVAFFLEKRVEKRAEQGRVKESLGLRELWSRALPLVFPALVLLTLTFLPLWNRSSHYISYLHLYDYKPGEHFRNIFKTREFSKDSEPLHLKDGPNTTVALISSKDPKRIASARELEIQQVFSIFVNGKSDGNSLGDYSTMFFLSALPYLLSPKGEGLQAAIIGFGTGISAGVLGRGEDVGQVEVLEISSAVLEATPKMDPGNYQVTKNPKIRLIHSDAFRHFYQSNKKYDLILSEPSNPWVAGVESLFTVDFFRLVKESLHENGIYALWFQNYLTHKKVVQMIFDGINRVFPHTKTYQIGRGDSLILASRKELKAPFLQSRFREQFLQSKFSVMKIHQPEDLEFLVSLRSLSGKFLALENQEGLHSLEHPKLSRLSNFYRFLSSAVKPFDLISEELVRFFYKDVSLYSSFQRLWSRRKDFRQCSESLGSSFFCSRVQLLLNSYQWLDDSYLASLENIDPYHHGNLLEKKIKAYQLLRRFQLIPPKVPWLLQSPPLLEKLQDSSKKQFLVQAILRQIWLDSGSEEVALGFLEKLHLSGDSLTQLKSKLKKFQESSRWARDLGVHLQKPSSTP